MQIPNIRDLEPKSIADLFEQQVALTPDAIAVEAGEQKLSYRELNERANQLASYLVRLGVSTEVPVGILAERSIQLVVAIFGVLKAGGSYVPLDPALPHSHLSVIMQDAQICLLLIDSALKTQLPPEAPHTIILDECAAAVAAEPADFGPPDLGSENLAYIVYTSGSSGKPKGVLIPHRVFMRCDYWAREFFRFTSRDRFLFKSIRAPEELLYPLFIGATVFVAPTDAERDPSLFVATIIKHRITVVGLSPAFLNLVLAEPDLQFTASLSHVLCSGEILPNDVRNRFHARCQANLYNFYGLAEAPYTTIWRCRAEGECDEVPIGHPIDARVLLLNSDLQPVGTGEVGEICIGGPGLARGYLNLPELTSTRFVSDPFNKGGQLYRTGDLAYYDTERQRGLVLVGRTDLQIKVRGFRLETGEVEAALRMHPGVREAAVTLINNEQGQPQLTGYLAVEAGTAITVAVVRKFLETKIPEHAIPSHFRILARLPRTTTDKLDRRALKEFLGSELPAGTPYVAPRNERERHLSKIWQELLGCDRVGINDNFFHLGGHSLLATQVVARIRAELGFELPLREFFEAPTIAEISPRLSSAASNGSRLFRRRRAEGPIELSFAQERLWFLDQLEPNSSAYHIPDAYMVNGRLDLAVLERGLRAVADRHELLRTTLRLIDGRPVQVIAPTSGLLIDAIDRRGLTETEQEAEIERQIRENSAAVFDLARGPLLRLKVVRLANERYLLLVNMHHVVSDDWSLGVFYRELSLFYAGFLSGRPVELPPLPIQYADYAVCQRQWLEGGELERQLVYWRQQLADSPTLELPTDFSRPPKQTFVGSRIPFTLSRDLTARIKQFDRQENATPFMSLLAAFQVLLSRYSGQSDIVIGTPIANRQHIELEALFGFFVNMLVLRTDLSGEPSFREVVSRIRRIALDAYENQDLPFDRLVEDLNPQRDLSRPPLFQVMFAIQDVPTQPLTFPGAAVARRVHAVHATHFDLELYLSTDGDAWSGFIGYNSDLFAATTIERMIGHYQQLLHSVLAEPDRSIYKAPMLADAERDQLRRWTGKSIDFGVPHCIHQLFEEQAARSPESIALQFEGQTLTYAELNSCADSLVGELQTLGVDRETRVGVCVERSLDMVVALLAVLKAGGAYVPIDIHFPADRITLILTDARAEVLVLHETFQALCAGFTGKKLVLNRALTAQRTKPQNVVVTGNNAAYIYFTSGSTGRPKGVIIEHRSVVNFLRAFQREPGITSADVVLALTTISFDPAVLDIFLPLSVGARVVIVPEATRMDPAKLLQLLHRSGATILQATPTTWQLLVGAEWKEKQLRALIGGEILTPELSRDILKRCGELWNLYGPTETTVWSTVGRVDGPDDITIGRVIANQRAYIVDAHGQLVPVGVPGELWMGGVGVGRYYVAQPELTAERFIPDPFSEAPGARLYRTGDFCRYRPDGRIQFLGRIDNQLKIRGFRVEPGEIEAALIEHQGIRQCVVVDRPDGSGEKRLIGYIVPTLPTSALDTPSLREFLKRKLPDYMVPSAFVVVNELPLTRTGKINRNALPAPDPVRLDSAVAAGTPRNPIERRIAQIWEKILQVDGVGLTDDFFQMGGHSLLAVRLMAEVNASLDIALPVATIFQAPTIEALAAAVLASNELRLKPPGLIAPRADERGQPIFWAPSVGSVERFLECHRFIRLLRGEFRFYGFDPAPTLTDINRLAQHCVELIRAEQANGPYYIVGYCQCGHVAYEIATRLEHDGAEVGLLVIIDASARDFAASVRQRLYWLRDGLRRDHYVVLDRVRGVVRRKIGRRNGGRQLVATNGQPVNRFVAHREAVRRHKARPFSGTIDLIRSDEWLRNLPHAPKLGWDALASTVRVHPVHCNHDAVLKDPASVQLIADILKESLLCQPM